MKPEDFRIAIITALPVEQACVSSILDERYHNIPRLARDENTYTYGRVGIHNVVLASLPSGITGNVSAGVVAAGVWHSFKKLEFGLIVGVGGGMPDMEDGNSQDIRLGDVVIGKPTETHGGVLKFDLGKAMPEGGFRRTGMLNRPPNALLTAVTNLQAKHFQQPSDIPKYLQEMLENYPHMAQTFSYPGSESDILFQADYDLQEHSSCIKCDPAKLIHRQPRPQKTPVLHYGTILTGDAVMRSGVTRKNLGREYNAFCIEMEAAGISSNFPCLVIRGICDYADSHKNKIWQPYAAATAAAFAKELLEIIPSAPEEEQPLSSTGSSKAVQDSSGSSFQIHGGIHSYGGKQIVGNQFHGTVNM